MAVKSKKISWWSNDAVIPTVPASTKKEEIEAEERQVAEELVQPVQQVTTPSYKVNEQGQLEPLIQPIVIVPYAASSQSMLHYREEEENDGVDYEYLAQRQQYINTNYDEYKYNPEIVVKEKKVKEKKPEKKYVKKNVFPIVMLLILPLIMIAVAVLGYFNIESITPFVSVFKNGVVEADETISMSYFSFIDPVLSLVSKFVALGEETVFGFDAMTQIEGMNENVQMIFGYVIPAAIAIYLVFGLIAVISSIVALAQKKKGKYIKKIKFGYASIIMIICSLVVILGGFLLTGNDFGFITNFMTTDYVGYALGLGAVISLVVPVLMLIFTSCAYKKEKNKKESK